MEKLTQPEKDVMQVIWQNNGGFIKEFLYPVVGVFHRTTPFIPIS